MQRGEGRWGGAWGGCGGGLQQRLTVDGGNGGGVVLSEEFELAGEELCRGGVLGSQLQGLGAGIGGHLQEQAVVALLRCYRVEEAGFDAGRARSQCSERKRADDLCMVKNAVIRCVGVVRRTSPVGSVMMTDNASICSSACLSSCGPIR